MITSITPVAAGQRTGLLDTLRGFALLGILMVNIHLFYQPVSLLMLGYTGDPTKFTFGIEAIVKFLFEGKFYTLFSFLFGYGFWLFLDKKSDDKANVVPVYRRRMLFLLLFGLAHIVLLWAGDILLFYAIFGFVLIMFRKCSDSATLKWSIVLAFIPALLYLMILLLIRLGSATPQGEEMIRASFDQSVANIKQMIELATNAYSSGTFGEIVSVRIKEFSSLLGGVFFFYPVALAMFLVGMLAARHKLIVNSGEHLPFFRKMLWLGLIIGLIFNVLYAISYQRTPFGVTGIWTFVMTISHSVGGIAFCAVYIAGFAILTAKGKLRFVFESLAPVGRMALTNYLMQSVISTTLFYSYGFALFGRVTAGQALIIALLIFVLQIIYSKYWLRYFHYGPMEWLWRTLTYMKQQPFRKKSGLIE